MDFFIFVTLAGVFSYQDVANIVKNDVKFS